MILGPTGDDLALFSASRHVVGAELAAEPSPGTGSGLLGSSAALQGRTQ